MKKQKRQFFVLIILLVVAVGVAFGVTKYLKYSEEKEAQKIAENTIYMTNLDPEEIESFTCWYVGEERRFEKQDGIWIAMNDTSADLQQDWMKKMVNALAQMTATYKLEQVTDLSEYGFDDSYKQYGIETADKTYKFILGGFNDVSDCYYMYEESDPTVVYVYEPNFVTGFVSTVEALKKSEDS